jgi:hypothetical protein
MQGHHRARERLRPRHKPTAVRARGDCQDQANGTPARLFLCRGCRVQVLICSHCDRGHVYCAEACAQKARRQSQREAGRRYQLSRRGRINHAARAGRYRARKNNVTHQGSAPDQSDDLLREDQAVAMAEQSARDSSSRRRWRCHHCGRHCSQLVRHDFLQRCRDSWPNRRGDRGKYGQTQGNKTQPISRSSCARSSS